MGRLDRLSAVMVVGLSVLAGCPHKGGTPGFSISYPDASATAKVGKPFDAKPAGRCFHDDGTEGRWAMSGAKVASGELPPGLTLEDGVIGGVPKAAGIYEATIELGDVTCAGKPYPGQTASVRITVK